MFLLFQSYRRRDKVFSFLDRFAGRLIAGSLLGVVIVLQAVRIYGVPCLPAQQIYAMAYELTLKEVQSVPMNPTIQVPIDFHYLDSERVKVLYNEIEQDLVEQQRTVGSTAAITGKVGGKGGPIEGEIGGSKQQNSSSTYQRLEFSPERKCVELMNYALKANKFKYLTTIDEWLRRRQASDFQARYNEILRRALPATHESPTPTVGGTTTTPTKDEQDAASRQIDSYRDELKSDLASLDGLLFIEGEFAISRTSQGTIILLERFSEIPRIVVRVTTSAAPGLNGITPGGRARLRVFGTVLRPLVGDAPIEVRPIAIF